MTRGDVTETARGASRSSATAAERLATTAAIVVVPLVLLALVRLRPSLDARWENHPAHFWLVLGASALATSLGMAVHVAARRRGDARLVFVSLAFVSGAGFLGLHALATPGVLLGPNAGFELATPVGLLLGGVCVGLSAFEFSATTSRMIAARSTLMLGILVGLMLAWALLSLASFPPLDDPLQQESLDGWQAALGVVGVLGYGTGVGTDD